MVATRVHVTRALYKEPKGLLFMCRSHWMKYLTCLKQRICFHDLHTYMYMYMKQGILQRFLVTPWTARKIKALTLTNQIG